MKRYFAHHTLVASLLIVAVLTGLQLFCVSPAAARESQSHIPAEYFAQPPAWRSVRISPDGEFVGALVRDDDQYALRIFSFGQDGDGEEIMRRAVDDEKVIWFYWANNERLLIATWERRRNRNGKFLRIRIIATDRDGGNEVLIGEYRAPNLQLGQVKPDFVDVNHLDDRHVLLAIPWRRGVYPDVYAVDVYTGELTRRVDNDDQISQWMVDRLGRVRLGISYADGKKTVFVRDDAQDDWRILIEYDQGNPTSFLPLAFAADPNVIFIASNHETGRLAIYRYDLQSEEFGERLFAHEEVDVRGMLVAMPERDPVGFLYELDRTRISYIDERSRQDHAWLDEQLPGRVNRLVSSSYDDRTVVVYSSNPTDPGSFYLWRRDARSLTLLGHRYPQLEDKRLSPMTAVTYEARDGLQIPAFITRPANLRAEAKIPLVVLPHGGPTARDRLRFDYWAQFLASRGYMVFQPNFRGSSGYGREFERAGHRQWGLAMQRDITDGVRWLIDQGTVDASRICIVGASFGGYAALMGLVNTPDLYRCAVSIAGVTDLRRYLRDLRSDGLSGVSEVTIGDRRRDRNQLKATSPINNIDTIKSPVLILHGSEDRVVRVHHARRFARKMRRADKAVEFVELEDSGHNLGSIKDRATVLSTIEDFLAQHLGVGADELSGT